MNKHLTAMLEIEAGEEIMYVGDHLYSDVLRSKSTLGWRSVFIMPELPEEMKTLYNLHPLQERIKKLRNLQDDLSTQADSICQLKKLMIIKLIKSKMTMIKKY